MNATLNKFAASWDALIDLDLLSDTLYWSRRLGCSTQQLRDAVRTVGRNAASVRRYLGR
jgi:hypothetical protein